MRTTLKIETPTKALEVALKLVDGKQIVELELSDLLSLLDGKNTKAPTATAKAPTAPKAPQNRPKRPSLQRKHPQPPKSAPSVVESRRLPARLQPARMTRKPSLTPRPNY